MALRGHLIKIARTRALTGGQPSRAQSVAVLGAPFSQGQVKIKIKKKLKTLYHYIVCLTKIVNVTFINTM